MEGAETAPFPFLPIAKKNEIRYPHQTLHTPPTSILRTVIKEIFQGSVRSAVNDVRVTSCSPDFGKNKGARESPSRIQFKDRTDWVSKTCRLNMSIKLLSHILNISKFEKNNRQKFVFFSKFSKKILELSETKHIYKNTC